MGKGEMQMKVKNFLGKRKNVQVNLLNLEQIDWQPNLSIKDKKCSYYNKEWPKMI